MSVDLYTLANAREFLREFVNAGSCDVAVLDARIDEAQRRLANKPEVLHRLRRRVRFTVQNQTFSAPSCVERILRVDVCGTPGQVWSDFYEFLSSGPGDLDFQVPADGYSKDVVDLGEFPTQFEPPGAYPLMAFSTAVEDLAKTITIRGFDAANDLVRDAAGSPAVALEIGRWKDGVEGSIFGALADQRQTAGSYREIAQVNKPITTGYVTLFAVDLVNRNLFFLSKMAPEETVPHYRRYRVTNQAATGDLASILALVQLRHVKAVLADDVLTIQNLDALKAMSMAITKENNDDPGKAAAYEALAVRLLLEQKATVEQAGVGMTVIDVEKYCSAGAFNRGIIL